MQSLAVFYSGFRDVRSMSWARDELSWVKVGAHTLNWFVFLEKPPALMWFSYGL